MLKKLISLLSCLVALLMLTSCGVTVSKQSKYNAEIESQNLEENVVQNDNYKLELNSSDYGVTLTDLKTGQIWGTTPVSEDGIQYDELGMPIKQHPQVESVLKVVYRNYDSRTDDLLLSYTDAVSDGRVRAEKTENGFRVEFYFDIAEIMIPVDYELLDDSVRISVDPTKIQENKHRVVQVSIAPFWAAAENDSENSYLFIPSGSGTIVETKTVSANGNSYTGQVYGKDPTIVSKLDVSNTEEIRLPVYGAKTGDTATLAIIDSADESAYISATAGSTQFGYSSVYSTFQVRGHAEHTATLFASEEVNNIIYTNPIITEQLAVRFFPLTGDSANYSGMAKRYREYLEETNDLPKTTNEKALNITIFGGKMITKSFLGIPYKTLYPLTTISEASDIVKKLNSELDGSLQVNLKGYTETGIDVGAVGGEFSLNSKLGSKEQLNKLISLCQENNLDMYMNFDIVKFNNGTGGFSVGKESAYNVGELKAAQYNYDIAVKTQEDKTIHYLLAPRSLNKAAQKLIEKTEKLNLPGISLDTLTNMSYSDYSDKDKTDFYSKSGMPDKVVEALNTVKKADKKLLATDSNLYAAVKSDAVIEVPVNSAKDYTFGYDVPFYSMVFKGSIPIYTASANFDSASKDVLLHAIEGGMGIGYSVISNWNNALINSDTTVFYNCVYNDLEESIISDAQKLNDYLSKVSGVHIASHNVLASGVRETVYENGVTVYVNYTDKAASSPAGEVAPHNYLVLEK